MYNVISMNTTETTNYYVYLCFSFIYNDLFILLFVYITNKYEVFTQLVFNFLNRY